MDQRGCYGSGSEVDQLVISICRRHTDPTLRAIIRSFKRSCTNNTQTRERTIVRSVGMVKYEGTRSREVVGKETRRDWAQHER